MGAGRPAPLSLLKRQIILKASLATRLGLVAALSLLLPGAAFARDQIQISGSSTVLPYATIVAEAFGENKGFATPVVEGGGSGAGRKRLCEGVGPKTIDIANSSSPIKQSDLDLCLSNGVNALAEVRIGYDGIVFVTNHAAPALTLTTKDLWLALAERIPAGGTFVPNPARRWSDVNPALPDLPITVFVPGTKHGSREVFDQKVLEAGCKAAEAEAAFAAAATGSDDDKAKAAHDACLKLRTDGASVDIDGDYTETLARLAANPTAVGVVGLSFYENNTDKLQVAAIEGVMPSVATIASGDYPVSRPLFFYVKPAHYDLVPGLRDYVAYFVSDEIAGPGGLLEGYGLVPDPLLAETQAAIAAGTGLAMTPSDTPVAAPVADAAPKAARVAPSAVPGWVLPLALVVALSGLGFALGRARAKGQRATAAAHSLPQFHGAVVAIAAGVAAVLGLIVHGLVGQPAALAGQVGFALVPGLAALGLALARITPAFRARNLAESWMMGLLIACSLVAVLTTVGIVASLVFETWHFFQLHPATNFFFSTEWNPQFRGGSSLGLWPLVWGTLYVSAIALAVAVPIGLMSAIYLSEYAGPKMRAIVKPAIEILAGIPTIVYGLFALITVGPLLRDWIAQPMGFGDSSSSVMTAGLVMGIMVIPFVSSLSDDILNAVPQALRDGSLGLGATPSETTRRVVIPAALPGIVGAVLLAASRAIGETMIVVMGAGAAAKLSLNPFEAMTTVTVKIVSQLTGDTEFASPETLVAFALGLTLFILTLGLNVIALVIVRKYREQYE